MNDFVNVPHERMEAMRLVPDRVLTETLYWMARAYERVHSMPRVSDTELANKIEAAKADLGRARDVSPVLSNSAAPAPEGGAVDDLIDRFATALKEKLHDAEAKYGHNDAWMRDDWQGDLVKQLSEHVAKGDPRDVAAYCAFAWHHGWSVGSISVSGENDLATREEAPAEAWEDWSRDDIETLISDALTDSFDVDWDAGDGAMAVLRALEKEGLLLRAQPQAREVAGPAEPEVGRAIYERIEKLMADDPNGWERAYLSHLVASVEEVGRYDGTQAREESQPVASAYRVRPEMNDPEEWTLMHPERAFDYLDRPGWETQPLYTHPAPDALRVAAEALTRTRRLVAEASESGFSDPDTVRALFVNNGAITQALAALQAEQKGGAA